MKYHGLKTFLAAQKQQRLRLSFEEVAKRAGIRLPPSAFEHPAWWANDARSHVQAKAWLEAGYRTENVNLAARRVEFVRTTPELQGVRDVQHDKFDHQSGAPPKKHPAAGALKGTFTIRDWDVTKPALDEDELAEWEANIVRKFDQIQEGLLGKK